MLEGRFGGSSGGELLSLSRGVEALYKLDIDLVSELQAPLLGIAANARVAKLKLQEDKARVLEYLQAIEFSSQNLVKLVDILLKSRDADSTNLALETSPLHLGIRVEEAIERLVPLCKVQAQVLDFKPKKSLIVSANVECLDLVVYHILEQALRFSASEEVIEIKLSASGQMAKLNICAKGSRQKAAALRCAFKKQGAKFGTSFSLVASYRLIKSMGGSLNISQRRDGVSFNFSLPLSLQSSLFGSA